MALAAADEASEFAFENGLSPKLEQELGALLKRDIWFGVEVGRDLSQQLKGTTK